MTHSTTTQRLEVLLESALTDLTILIGQDQTVDVGTFGSMLRQNRSAYMPDLRRAISSARLKTNNAETQNVILEAIKTELADYIRDGRIYSATIGYVHGKHLEYLLRSLLVRAVADGPSAAAQALSDCKTDPSCKFHDFVAISGIRIPEQTRVADGITLIPLPESINDFPWHIPSLFDSSEGISVEKLKRKTLVRVEYETSPILHKPEEDYTIQSGPDKHFKTKFKGNGILDPEIDLLLQCLSLAGNCVVESVMDWQTHLNYEVFDMRPTISLSGPSRYFLNPGKWNLTPTHLDEHQLRNAISYYKKLSRDLPKLKKKLAVPIDRWKKSKAGGDQINQFIDLGIALESLYALDGRSEIRYKLAVHGAWHLGETREQRRKLMTGFRKFYDARSDAVHTGILDEDTISRLGDVSDFLHQAQTLCRQGMIKIIDEEGAPDWSDLISGDDPV